MSSLCPFAGATTGGGVCPVKSDKSNAGVCPAKSDKSISGVCPVTGKDHGSELKESSDHGEEKDTDPRMVPAKCPFGYDSNTFKLGPLSCIVCQALLHESSKCKPCAHKFCKACISRFKDCPLCGADIEGIEPDAELQALVDRFIDGHARIKRSHATGDVEAAGGKNKVIYEDVSMERGAFLVQQAMRLVHTLSVSLNKIGDLRYYDGDLQSARNYYARSLDVRRNAVKEHSAVASQVIDLATSLAKVADVDRNLGNESAAVEGFEEAIQCLEKLKLDSEQASLERRRLSVLDFLHNQLADK
ncbi:unnamed protein product [Miscanthus lutarioriparius]|uniref:RING-type domain-containing protein n=1 Tax=Miscanthus lutarioriparius TaxID=422564 RepID=A0A811PBF3_9POAL|nr:unnamed protein product [Miscanthus lutarioriparius]